MTMGAFVSDAEISAGSEYTFKVSSNTMSTAVASFPFTIPREVWAFWFSTMGMSLV